jgi:hypothetical protein
VGYYYLIPQLKHLIYGQEPPLSPEAFIKTYSPLMKEEDARLLGLLTLAPRGASNNIDNNVDNKHSDPLYTKDDEPSGCRFIDEYRKWERVLRLNIAKQRAIKLKREPSAESLGVAGAAAPVEGFEILPEAPLYPQDAVAAAVKAAGETPIEGEDTINRARWAALEGFLTGLDYFDRSVVFAYFYKLLILARRQMFEGEAGFTEYKSLYASILKKSGSLSLGEYT